MKRSKYESIRKKENNLKRFTDVYNRMPSVPKYSMTLQMRRARKRRPRDTDQSSNNNNNNNNNNDNNSNDNNSDDNSSNHKLH